MESLSPGQIVKMAESSTLLCKPRFDDKTILDMLPGHSRDRHHALASAHAAILAAGQPVEETV